MCNKNDFKIELKKPFHNIKIGTSISSSGALTIDIDCLCILKPLILLANID